MKSPLSPFRKEVLPNGLTVIAKQVTATPIAAVYLWVRAGSVCESPEINGISHFFEHMFFKGTEKRGVGEMDRAIKELGGYNNAFTGFEYTAYYAVVPAESFTTAFEILYDAVTCSKFDPEEIERERQVIKEEIRRHEDNPRSKLFTEFLGTMFQDLPYGRPILGTEASLDRIGREDFLAYLNDFYAPDTTIAVVVGDVEEDRILSTVAEMAGGWKRPAERRRSWPDISYAMSSGVRTQTVEKAVNVGYWALGFPTLGRSRMEDLHILDVATTILGSGRSCRLHRRLVEEMKIASSIGAWVWPFERAGILGVDAEFLPVRCEEVEAATLAEVERMGREPVRPEEVDKAKRMLLSGFAYANETDSHIANTLGRYQTISTLDEALRYGERIRAVTVGDVQRVMAEYGRREACTVAYIKPKE